MSDTHNILYLFDRPSEPIFTRKGEDEVSFDLPPDYLIDRYKPLASEIQNRFPSGKTISVTKLKNLPDLSFVQSLKRNAPFSLFNPNHGKMAGKLIEILMASKNFDELLSLAVYMRDRINPSMFIYALSVVIIHRPDTRNVELPSHAEIFPNLYIDSTIFSKAREEATVLGTGSRMPIEIPHDYTANNLDPEHRLSYFREDIGVNLHHWHWHLVYPFDGPLNIVKKDRRGELFYYMHQQIIARYNLERLSNNMNRVVRLTNWREPIEEGYFPKLDNVLANRVWPSRPANSRFKNIIRETDQLFIDIEDMERWRDRIFNAIHAGYITRPDGFQVRLTETDGIDILGNIIENSILSENVSLYGALHNSGHQTISFIHDPDNRHLENFGVMGDVTTAMRDPIFYRWHSYIDDIFQEFKSTLSGYTVDELNFENVRVQSVEISSNGVPRNELATFWQQSDVNLSRGLDFLPRGSVFARFTHLQHAPFSYKIIVENNGNQRIGTIRIFIAPKFDERGLGMLFKDQRKLFVELDKFSYMLSRGRNEIVRPSIKSSVTIPHEVTYRNLDRNRPADKTTAAEAFNFCGCGWPQNMLIPKGSVEGFQCQLFVMVSNGAKDRVEGAKTENQTCDDASSFCGIRNSLYPDSRTMGYPFDRMPREGVATLSNFLTSNMTVQNVTIRFTNRTVAPLQQKNTSGTKQSSSGGNRN